MSKEVIAGNGSWLAEVGERAALPRGKRRADYAVEVRADLLERQNSQVHKIMARTSSQKRIDGWAGLLKQPQVRFFAYCPQDAISVFGAGLRELQRWSTLAEIYEACYARCDQSASEKRAGSELPYGERLSAAQLSRTRWVLLSQPFVSAARPERVDLWCVNDEPGRLVALAQQARDDWLTVLAAIDDYPLLGARIGDLEPDAVTLAITQVTEVVLDLDPSFPADQDPVGREAASYAVTRLLLPKFAWAAAARAYLRWASWLSRALSGAALLAVVAVLVQVMIAFWLPWTPGYTAAAITAVAVYPLIGFAMAAEPGAAWPWLLRQPASAAVGLLALAAFGTTWWYTGSSRGEAGRAVLVMGGLAAAALLYLYFEAIGHGVRGWRLLRRPAWVTLLGLVHGLLISLIGLRFLLPFFASAPPHGPQLSCWYSAGSCHDLALPVPLLLGLAAAWSLAAGVFLQIIWDSEPVTAPLAHVSWRRGG